MNKIIIVMMIVLLFPMQTYAYEYKNSVYYIEGTLDSQSKQPVIVYAANFIKQINPECDPYFLYLWVSNYMEYDSIKFKNKNKYTYNATTSLIQHKGTCVDFSLLYCVLCRALGYNCNIVVGADDKNPHMWNEVFYKGKWIQVDILFSEYSETTEYESYVSYKIK